MTEHIPRTIVSDRDAQEVVAFVAAAMDALRRATRALGADLGELEPEPEPDLAGPPGLTDRERQVALLVGSGHSNQQIARRLCVSVRTVEAHLSHIYRKLRVESRLALCRLVAAWTAQISKAEYVGVSPH